MTFADFPRIAVDAAICGGRPVITGTRMRISDVLEMLAAGTAPDEIVRDFPYLAHDDIRATLRYAAMMAAHPVVLAAE